MIPSTYFCVDPFLSEKVSQVLSQRAEFESNLPIPLGTRVRVTKDTTAIFHEIKNRYRTERLAKQAAREMSGAEATVIGGEMLTDDYGQMHLYYSLEGERWGWLVFRLVFRAELFEVLAFPA